MLFFIINAVDSLDAQFTHEELKVVPGSVD